MTKLDLGGCFGQSASKGPHPRLGFDPRALRLEGRTSWLPFPLALYGPKSVPANLWSRPQIVENEVALGLINQAGRVRKCRQVLANLLRRAPLLLELQSLGFGRLRPQPVNERHILGSAHSTASTPAPARQRTSTFPVTTSEIKRVRYRRSRSVS